MIEKLKTLAPKVVLPLVVLVGLSALGWGKPGELNMPPVVKPSSTATPPHTLIPNQEAFIDNMIQKLTDPDYTVRCCAARALGRIGPAAMKAVPALSCVRCDSNTRVQASATLALQRIDPDTFGAAPDARPLRRS